MPCYGTLSTSVLASARKTMLYTHIYNNDCIDRKKLLRSIFGPTKERYGTWRIKTNDEF
jgi:hypothetical protein